MIFMARKLLALHFSAKNVVFTFPSNIKTVHFVFHQIVLFLSALFRFFDGFETLSIGIRNKFQ